MQLNLKSILASNVVLKIVSFLIGFTFWCIVSRSHIATIQVPVPLCFYGQQANSSLSAPESVLVTLRAPRTLLSTLDMSSLSLHINAAAFHSGGNPLILTREQLFLPDHINVLHYSPSNIVVTVT